MTIIKFKFACYLQWLISNQIIKCEQINHFSFFESKRIEKLWNAVTNTSIIRLTGSFVIACNWQGDFLERSMGVVSHFTSLHSVDIDAPRALDSVSRLKHYMSKGCTMMVSHLPSHGIYSLLFWHIPHHWQGVYTYCTGCPPWELSYTVAS